MQAATISALDDYYAQLFGIDRTVLWSGVTVGTHIGRLDGYEGYYVAWRGDGIHVSVPTSADGGTIQVLSSAAIEALQSLAYWRAFATTHGLRLIGPSTHSYLDRDPGPVDVIARLQEDDLQSLRPEVDEADWTESGWNDEPPHIFGLRERGAVVAAANLNPFHDQPRDVGVIVARGSRGRGLSVQVGQHAASFAIRSHGFARWGARNTNLASLAAARRLGFEPWCTQLAVRRADG